VSKIIEHRIVLAGALGESVAVAPRFAAFIPEGFAFFSDPGEIRENGFSLFLERDLPGISFPADLLELFNVSTDLARGIVALAQKFRDVYRCYERTGLGTGKLRDFRMRWSHGDTAEVGLPRRLSF
jgi:hypothetical protein